MVRIGDNNAVDNICSPVYSYVYRCCPMIQCISISFIMYHLLKTNNIIHYVRREGESEQLEQIPLLNWSLSSRKFID